MKYGFAITPNDVHVYKTLAGSWRAYLRNYREHFNNDELLRLNVWAITKESALYSFKNKLIENNIPFDWSNE